MNRDELAAKAHRIDSLFYELMDDVMCATDIWHERGDEFSHRLYVRTVFACVEGVIQVMKSAALLFDEINELPVLTPEELAFLREEEVQTGNNDEVAPKKKKTSLLQNFQFAFHTYAKVRGETVKLDKGGQGWQSLSAAIKIRNRLMHPHTLKELHVPLKDMEIVEQGMKFFRDTTAQLLHR
ncbi:MAG: hypothetical protein ACYC2W_10615 [Desulfurivibrionaceae bacterium]